MLLIFFCSGVSEVSLTVMCVTGVPREYVPLFDGLVVPFLARPSNHVADKATPTTSGLTSDSGSNAEVLSLYEPK
jgi:hypothetical protein